MSSTVGKMVTCDICGRKEFAELKDGKFSGISSAWGPFMNYSDVCPGCISRIREAVQNAIAKIRKERGE